MSGLKNLKKNEILFREGDVSEAMYVIKSGKIAITKAKGTSEIVLAELSPGDMLGEMAFFDSKPRSAGAKALVDSVVIELPFKALNAQFKTFPEWVKAIVRTVNTHLRNANQKIKNLEKTAEEETLVFPPHTVTRLAAILGVVGKAFGEVTAEGVLIPPGTLRRYTIQIFQQPTNKMQMMMNLLQGYGYMKVEDLGEGKQKITVHDLKFILEFVDFYNDWIFKSEDKRTTVWEKEMRPLKALIEYGKKETPNEKGEVKVNLSHMQERAQKEINQPFFADEIDSLSKKGLSSEPFTTDKGLSATININDLQRIYPYWELIYAFQKIQRD
jgi:CRP/FNR family transcriptional regulator, cyclic AMP receptor protein